MGQVIFTRKQRWNTLAKDNFDQAIERLYGLTVLLYGGYYEPKSDRDKELADELHQIWLKHSKE